MANLTNPTFGSASFALNISRRETVSSSQKIATGKNGPDDIVDYVVGSKLDVSASVLRNVTKSSTYGIRMLGIAEQNLISIRELLNNLRYIIAEANTANGDTLVQLDALYQQGVKDVMRILNVANFDGRNLFDGTLSIYNVGAPQQNIPTTAQPISIRAGEIITNGVTVTVPRLLPGDGTVADVPVPGIFTPLFATTAGAATGRAMAYAVTQVANGDATTMRADWLGRQVITNPLQQAISDAAFNAANAYWYGAPPLNPADQADATAQGIGGSGQAYVDAKAKSVAIRAAAQAAGCSADALAAIDLVNYPLYATPKRISDYMLALPIPANDIGAAIIKAARDAAQPPLAANAVAQKARSTGAAIAVALASGATNLSVGNLLTSANQVTADALISGALSTVVDQVTNLGGQLQILQRVADNVNDLIKVQDEAAGDYLNTNYEDATTNFKSALLKTKAAISILTQSFQVPEATLQLIS